MAGLHRQALDNAGWTPAMVDSVSAWGPGHPVIDRIEAEALAEVLGCHSSHIPVYSIKGIIGNPMAAAGPLQVAAWIFSFRDGVVPPTANLEVPIPEAPLDFVRGEARRSFPQTALLNAHGVGGANVTLLLKAPRTSRLRLHRHQAQPHKTPPTEIFPSMNPSHSVLVAFAHDGLRSALNVVEALEPIADVQLCSYDQLHQPPPQEPDVALCIVTDDESLDLAHEFQVRLEDVPTLVVDSVGGLKIEVNGYAGRISSSPDQVVKAVRHLLVPRCEKGFQDVAKDGDRANRPGEFRVPSTIRSPEPRVEEQTPEAILIAASRQLSWDLRADRVEVFLRTVEKNAFRKVYAEPESIYRNK